MCNWRTNSMAVDGQDAVVATVGKKWAKNTIRVPFRFPLQHNCTTQPCLDISQPKDRTLRPPKHLPVVIRVERKFQVLQETGILISRIPQTLRSWWFPGFSESWCEGKQDQLEGALMDLNSAHFHPGNSLSLPSHSETHPGGHWETGLSSLPATLLCGTLRDGWTLCVFGPSRSSWSIGQGRQQNPARRSPTHHSHQT